MAREENYIESYCPVINGKDVQKMSLTDDNCSCCPLSGFDNCIEEYYKREYERLNNNINKSIKSFKKLMEDNKDTESESGFIIYCNAELLLRYMKKYILEEE